MANLFFKDLGKTASDLLENDFKFQKTFSFATKTDNGIVIKTKGNLAENQIRAGLLAQRKYPNGISIENVEIKTNGRVAVGGSAKLSDSLTLKLDVEDGKHTPGNPLESHGIVGIDFCSPRAVISSQFDAINGPIAKVSGLMRAGRFLIGLQCDYDTQLDLKGKPHFSDYNLGFGFASSTWQSALITKKKMSTLDLSFSQNINQNLTVACKAETEIEKVAPQIVLGSSYKIDDFSTLKTKIDSNAVVSVALVQQINRHTTLICAGAVDTKDWSAESHKLGAGISFNFV
ncbi:unnamed protein product [Heterosigma akashiwo]